jgi:hypothetical protein
MDSMHRIKRRPNSCLNAFCFHPAFSISPIYPVHPVKFLPSALRYRPIPNEKSRRIDLLAARSLSKNVGNAFILP